METKTVIKVISLYDLIANNLLILLATLHHIIIIAFNYYYIYTLEDFISNCDDTHRIVIDELLTNLEYCQGVTIITFVMLFIIVASNDDVVQLNQNRVFIMCVSFILKVVYSAIQFWYYGKPYISLKESNYFQDKYIILLLISYDIRLMVPIFIIFICIIAAIFETISHITHFAKNYKFNVITRIEVSPNNNRID